MVDALKSFLDALKSTTYGALAMLLPGAAIVELSLRVVPINGLLTRAGVISYLAVSYIAGAAVQGVTAYLFSLRPLRSLGNSSTLRESEDHAQRILEAKLGEKVSRVRVLDLCLSRVEAKREGYDKFVALRDMSRGLVLVSLLAAAVIAVRHGRELLTMQYGAALLGCLIVAAAFLERYRCFAPLGRQVIFAQFIAGEMKQSKPQPKAVAAKNKPMEPQSEDIAEEMKPTEAQ